MENREEVFLPSSVRQARILELENYSNFELAEVITAMEINAVKKDVEIANLKKAFRMINDIIEEDIDLMLMLSHLTYAIKLSRPLFQ